MVENGIQLSVGGPSNEFGYIDFLSATSRVSNV